jgi:hypothetical protein
VDSAADIFFAGAAGRARRVDGTVQPGTACACSTSIPPPPARRLRESWASPNTHTLESTEKLGLLESKLPSHTTLPSRTRRKRKTRIQTHNQAGL